MSTNLSSVNLVWGGEWEYNYWLLIIWDMIGAAQWGKTCSITAFATGVRSS